ncbi:MAG TPA: RNA chaperone Hfq [Rhodospirillaceae bacterium]|nr:RNA chaperone Hfq [Rhodospirillaceae bacterium]
MVETIQDVFLNSLLTDKVATTVFLVNGVKLQGMITCFDSNSVLLRRDGHAQLIFKHAISTIMPNVPVQVFGGMEECIEQETT